MIDKETYALKGILEEKYGCPVTHIGANLCSNSGVRLTSVILPPSITYIGANAFEKQTILSALAMPGVKYVGKSAFEGCGKVALLRTYEQPKLEYVAQKAFYGCNEFQLDSVNCFDTIEDYAFCDSGLENIDLGGCVTTIGNECFSNCENLKTITISAANPPSLSGNLFSGTTHLMAIFVPSSGIDNYKTHKV
ncbi:MAG: leucine-rich repeat domain-containing protein [Mycoplasmoidaceae bacterium]|nr:leucine-rich repeat domain-containing protein [Mycoplasmoidaceae bacterium]